MLILGIDAISRSDGEVILNMAKKIAEKFNLIQENWNGFNLLHKNSGLINGLELGFTCPDTIEKIIKNSQAVFLLGVDDAINFETLKDKFVIYIGSHGDSGAKAANVILPGVAYSEKEATYVNCEGRPQKTTRAIYTPTNAKEDWQIIAELAVALNIKLGFENIDELRASMFDAHESLRHLDKITKAKWHKDSAVHNPLDTTTKLVAQNFDFYLTNAIARASRILHKCSNSFTG